MNIIRFRPQVRRATLVAGLATLVLAPLPGLAGGPVGPGAITLPPITNKYDEQCLSRIDKHDEKLAAQQSRECRKPRGSRNGLPTAHGAEPIQPPSPAKPQ